MVSAKTFGVIGVGLAGLLAFIGVFIGAWAHPGFANGMTYFGLTMTVILLLVVFLLVSLPSPPQDAD